MSALLSQYLQEDPKPGSLWGDDTYHVTFHPTGLYDFQTLVNLLIKEEDPSCRLAIDYELRAEPLVTTREEIYQRDEHGKTVYGPTFSGSIATSPVLIADRSSSPWGTCWSLVTCPMPNYLALATRIRKEEKN